MKTTLDHSRPGQRRCVRPLWRLLGIGIGALVANVSAQSVPAPAAAVKDDEAPVVLSPFVVETNQDVGYLAQNSLAGSRLNTNIGDLASPITAFTKEFLDDVAVTNVDDLTKYMLSTKPDYPETDNLFMTADSRRFRIRGLPAFNYSVNFFENSLRLDRYNTERIEQSRGPNSILFGLGSPGGVVNVVTKKASEGRDFGSLRFQVNAINGLRTEVDYNHVLIPKKLAVRVAAVRDHENGWRFREFDEQDRVYLTAGWQITPRTRLDVEGERGSVHKSLLQMMPASDAYTNWVAAGRNVGAAPNTAQAIKRISTTNYQVVDTSTGVAMNWINKTNSTTNTVGGVQIWISDPTIVAHDVVIGAGVGFPQNTEYWRSSFALTHAVSSDLTFELAGNMQDSDQEAVTARGGTLLQVDTSPTLPNNQPNPNVGKAYVEHFPGTVDAYDGSKNLRLSGAYTKDLGRWFGKHQFAALYQLDWIQRQAWQMRPIFVTNPYITTDPLNGQNNIRFRTYVEVRGDRSLIGHADWRRFFGGGDDFRDHTFQVRDAVTGREMTAAFTYNSVPGDNDFERDSAMAILQSQWLGSRLLTVAGIRKDWQRSWYSLTDPAVARAPAKPPFTLGEYTVVKTGNVVENDAQNVTASALFRVTKNVALTYNRARNSALPDPNATIVGGPGGFAPNPLGESEDAGLKVNFGKRLSASFVYYETSAKKDTANSSPEIENRFGTVWAALAAANVPAPDGGSALNVPSKSNRYTFDSTAKGYELELIANPTDNWRIFLNYSDGVVKRTNIGLEARAYMDQYRSYWLQGTNGRVLIDGSGGLAAVADDGDSTIETVAEQVASMDRNITDLYIVPDGEQGRGQVRDSFNLVSTYSFANDALKGLSVGGGVNYRSGEVVAYNITKDAAGNATADVIRGRDNTLLDLHVTYRSRAKWLGRNVRWSVQLNVTNVLDEDQILPTRIVSGVITNFRVQEPRQWVVSTQFDF